MGWMCYYVESLPDPLLHEPKEDLDTNRSVLMDESTLYWTLLRRGFTLKRNGISKTGNLLGGRCAAVAIAQCLAPQTYPHAHSSVPRNTAAQLSKSVLITVLLKSLFGVTS